MDRQIAAVWFDEFESEIASTGFAGLVVGISNVVVIPLEVVMKNDIERLKNIDSHAPACALPPNTTDDLTESKEEREAFELLERRQRDPQTCSNRQAKINAMAEIARQCHTTSIEGICALLVDAGYEKVINHG